MDKLSYLAEAFGTDKRMADHAYTPIYEKWLSLLKDDVKSMLEIGFGGGASIKMWMEYYPMAKIYCMEYKDNEYEEVWNKPNLNIESLNLILGDSTKKESWDKVPYDLDFIVEDGSHFPQDQIETFKLGFPHVKSGGLYFLEDTHCGGEQKYGATTMLYDWVRDLMIRQQAFHVQTGGDFYKATPYMDDFTKQIFSISSYKSLIIFQKA